jgi:hypothetical protein
MFIGASLSGISAHRVRIQSHILNNAEDVNLATWLATQSPDANKIQQVTIPSGQTIGGTSTGNYALTTGNLASYTKGVELIILGNIEGKGGAANGGAGSHGLEATSDIHIVDTSNIYAGGGGGGNGGLGGYGAQAINQSGPYYQMTNVYVYRFGAGEHSYWASTDVGVAGDGYINYGGDWYRSAAHVEVNRYYISRYDEAVGVKGTGGAGGVGQGYNQSAGSSNPGSGGTYRAGTGGTGGAGAAWGTAGTSGTAGSTGYYMTTSDWSKAAAGGAGVTGGAAGNETVENGGSIINTHLY